MSELIAGLREEDASKQNSKITLGWGRMENFARKLAYAAATAAGICLLTLMLITFVDVIGRYFFNSALPFAVELIQLGMGLLVFLGLAMTTLEKGHISVDLLSASVSPFVGKILAWLAAVSGALFFGLVSWQLFVRAAAFKSDGLATQVLFLPVYPVAFVMAFASVFVTLICLYQIFRPDADGG